MLHFVPSMLGVFLEEDGVEECRSVRQIISSGEALTGHLERRMVERMEWAELDNLYGPTEAAVDVTWWRCRRGERRANVPIGKAIGNVRMYVLNERLEAVPAGVTGEVYIGGVQVGRGYWAKAAMTAEKFIPDPHSPGAGARMYRTGDVGRYIEAAGETGVIEYLGRTDGQVKVRGYRIETGEVEAVMEACAGVSAAAVRVFGEEAEGGSGKQLTGYVVKEGEEVRIEEIRQEMAKRLPALYDPECDSRDRRDAAQCEREEGAAEVGATGADDGQAEQRRTVTKQRRRKRRRS